MSSSFLLAVGTSALVWLGQAGEVPEMPSDVAPQRMGSAPLPPELEARAQTLGKGLRCAVCQGLSITDSPSSMARAQLDKVRELLREGRSDDEINAYFVARYGEWVLLEPVRNTSNALLWMGPGLLLVGGLLFIVFFLSRRRPALAPAAPATVQASAPPVDASLQRYLDQVRTDEER